MSDWQFRRSLSEVLIEQTIIAVLAIPVTLAAFWLFSCIAILLGPLTVLGVVLEALYKDGYPIILAAPMALAFVAAITAMAYGLFILSGKYDTECVSIYYASGEIVLGIFIVASYFDLIERGWL